MQENQKKLEEFRARMSAWVTSQGLLFQLVHGGGGASSALMSWVTRMGLRVALLLLIGLVVFYAYLLRRPFAPSFGEGIRVVIEKGLNAESAEIGPTARKEGILELSSLEMVGSEGTFFDSLSARNIKTRMRVTAGILGLWRGDSINVERLAMKVKSGSETLDADRVFGVIFGSVERFDFDRVEIEDASIAWGYSTSTAGAIKNTKLSAKRSASGWKLKMLGGTFSQNWLRDMRVEALELDVSKAGIKIVEAQFGKGDGRITLSGTVKGPIVNPQVDAKGMMEGFPLKGCVQPEVAAVLQGRISGAVKLGGSPYGSSGITVSVQVDLGPEDEIIVTDEVELLDVISLVDRYRSYKKVRFRTGGFTMETGRNVAVFTGINLSAKDHVQLEGEFMSRRPSDKEVSIAIYKTENLGEEPSSDGGTDTENTGSEFDLVTAARAARELSDSDEKIRTIFQSQVFGQEVMRREEEARASYRSIPYLVGAVSLGLHPKAFEEKRSPVLSELFPVEENSGLRWLKLDLNNSLPVAGSELAEKILEHAKN